MLDKYNVIDLFVGCGGLSEGFEQTEKYNTIACIEWEKSPCITLENRLKTKWNYENASDVVLRFDIQRTEELVNGWKDDPEYGSNNGLDKMVFRSSKNIDLIIGGPPCQAYSIAGRVRDENGMNDDYRNFLFESYIRIVKHFSPKVFVFENVPGLLSAKPGGKSIVARITKAFKDAGYEITSQLKENALMDCTLFGIPQKRNRMIIVGVNKLLIKENSQKALHSFYQEILPKYHSPKKTVKEAISDLPPLYPLKKVVSIGGKKYSHEYGNKEFHNHIPRMHNSRDIKIFRLLAEDIVAGTNVYLTTESLKDLYFQMTGKISNIHKYYVLRCDMQSNTIPAHLYKDGLRHIHPDPTQARSITVREAARLQTFPDDFEFLGSMSDQYKMIGNAVPPQFAKAVALALDEFLQKYF